MLLDYISDVYNAMSRKFSEGTYWIIAGDTNELKLDAILNLTPHMHQAVQSPTRLNPPRLLDPILTTLSKFYQIPECQRPLDADPGTGGAPSDHLCVKFSPLTVLKNKPARKKRKVKIRPMPESKYNNFEKWLKEQTWENVTNVETVDEQAEALQSMSLEAMNVFFPEKEVNFSSDDQPWIDSKIKTEIRKRQRIYSKHRKNKAWEEQNQIVVKLIKKAKQNFYKKQVDDCKKSKDSQWYTKLKRMCKYDQHSSDEVIVEEISEQTHEKQANLILDSILEVNNLYEPLKKKSINIPTFENESIPHISEKEVESYINQIKTKPSTPPDDIPDKVVKRFAKYFSVPLAHIVNSCIERGEWPSIWKVEAITPVPKVHPPKKLEHLRPISGLKLFNKI